MLPIQNCKLCFILFFFLCQFFHPAASFAGDIQANDAANYFRVIWGLLVVLGIILILYGFLKKRFSLLSTSANQHIKIVEIKPLMGRKVLCLINVKGQEHLLGISGDRITHIAALSPQPEPSFAEVLQATGVTVQL
jgi:flagellar protein FliO/FliZ